MSLVFTIGGLMLLAALGSAPQAGQSAPSNPSIEPCPDRPNCVSSLAPKGPRRMDPIPFRGSVEDARKRLVGVISSIPRAAIVKDEAHHVKVEFRSAVFSFVDDVDFVFDDASKMIHFRSASRVGYYDFGVNRKRMERVIRRFTAKER